MNDTNPNHSLDILRRMESLTASMDVMMKKRSEAALQRYPLTFAFLVLLGAISLSEGVKGLLGSVALFEEHPLYLLLAGLVILTVTGTLYKKLEK